MKIRSFFKWPGGKSKILKEIFEHLPPGKRVIEPFCGSGVVFFNFEPNQIPYWLNDLNPDLINFYQHLKTQGLDFIAYCRQFFNKKYNAKTQYYAFREKFNHAPFGVERSALFLYLNRHGYNGLCRYNRSGFLNVPFGQYIQPYFPETELKYAIQKLSTAKITCMGFEEVFKKIKKGDVLYCDPPYYHETHKKSFTQYFSKNFDWQEQCKLLNLIEKCQKKGASVLISNHDTPEIRKLYANASLIKKLSVGRSIGCQGKSRLPVLELLALYPGY
ncbi:MAG: DNA adenine methylase [Gammaproteobacteria bacterium]